MKKPISIFLAASIAIPTILTAVSGCVKASATDIMTNGELLELINNKFGFEGYESSESYYTSVPSSDVFFDAVQTAHEYEVLDELVTDFKTSDVVTREFFAMAASGAIYNDYTDEISINDISDITYKDDVLTVLNYGIMELDGGKFEPKKTMSGAECVLLVDAAFDIWTNCSVVKPKYDVQLKDGVIDLGGAGMYYYDEDAGEMKFDEDSYNQIISKLEKNNYSYDPDSGVVKIDSVSDFGIEVGSVMTVPTGDKLNPFSMVKVTNIEKDSDGQYKLITITPEMQELYETYSVEQTIKPDLSNAGYVYDLNGNLLTPVADDSENIVGGMGLCNDNISDNYLSNGLITYDDYTNNIYSKTAGKTKTKYEFAHEDKSSGLGIKIGLTVSDDSFSISAGGSISTLDKKHGGSDIIKGSISYSAEETIKNINVDYKYDFWGGYAKVVLRHDHVSKASAKGSIKASIPLCKIGCPTGIGDLTVWITPKLNIGLDGELSITVTNSGVANGLEYRRWHGFNSVSDEGTKSLDAKAEVKIEATVSVDVKITCLAVLGVGVEPEAGFGALASSETNLIDTGEEKPISLQCVDVKCYPILKAKVYGEIDFFFGKVKKEFSWTILGEKNVMLEIHLESRSDILDEGLKIVPECTKDQLMNIKKDKETEQAGVKVGTELKLTDKNKRADIGSQFSIGITEVPSGYNYEDIYVKVANSEVLDINSTVVAANYKSNPLREAALSMAGPAGRIVNGILGTTAGVALDGYSCSFTGKTRGQTIITFVTKDGKYKATCDVIVLDPNEPLDLDVKLDTYGVTIPENTCYKFNVVKLPWYLTEDKIIWSTSDVSVVTVGQNGVVTAVGEGYAMVTASTPDETSKAF